MAEPLPPPAERFDAITARWLSPGGPLHDPEREGLDPTYAEPVTLVGPVPRELSAPGPLDDTGHSPSRRRWWVVLAVVAFTLAFVLIGVGL